MEAFQIWWLLVAVPLFQIFSALKEAWGALLHAGSEEERQEIIGSAGAKAFVNTILAILIAVAPWPWKLLGFIPALWPAVTYVLAEYFHIYMSVRFRRRM